MCAGSQGGILVSIQKFLDHFHCPFYLVLGRKFSCDNHAMYVGVHIKYDNNDDLSYNNYNIIAM